MTTTVDLEKIALNQAAIEKYLRESQQLLEQTVAADAALKAREQQLRDAYLVRSKAALAAYEVLHPKTGSAPTGEALTLAQKTLIEALQAADPSNKAVFDAIVKAATVTPAAATGPVGVINTVREKSQAEYESDGNEITGVKSVAKGSFYWGSLESPPDKAGAEFLKAQGVKCVVMDPTQMTAAQIKEITSVFADKKTLVGAYHAGNGDPAWSIIGPQPHLGSLTAPDAAEKMYQVYMTDLRNGFHFTDVDNTGSLNADQLYKVVIEPQLRAQTDFAKEQAAKGITVAEPVQHLHLKGSVTALEQVMRDHPELKLQELAAKGLNKGQPGITIAMEQISFSEEAKAAVKRLTALGVKIVGIEYGDSGLANKQVRTLEQTQALAKELGIEMHWMPHETPVRDKDGHEIRSAGGYEDRGAVVFNEKGERLEAANNPTPAVPLGQTSGDPALIKKGVPDKSANDVGTPVVVPDQRLKAAPAPQ